MTRTIEYQCEVCGAVHNLALRDQRRRMRITDVHDMSIIHCTTCNPAREVEEAERIYEMTVDDGIGMPSPLVVTKRRDDE